MTNERFNLNHLIRHEFFDGNVPHTDSTLDLLEETRSKEVVDLIKKIHRGNLRITCNPFQDHDQPQ